MSFFDDWKASGNICTEIKEDIKELRDMWGSDFYNEFPTESRNMDLFFVGKSTVTNSHQTR